MLRRPADVRAGPQARLTICPGTVAPIGVDAKVLSVTSWADGKR